LISLSTSFAGIGDSGLVRKVADGFVVVFLLANLVIRFSTMFHYPPYNGYIAACGAYPGFLLEFSLWRDEKRTETETGYF